MRREVSPAAVGESRVDAPPPMSPPPAAAQSKPADVVDAAPVVQAASGERSSTAARQQLENLPSAAGAASHNFLGYVNLQPGVSSTTRVAGGGQSNFMLDGLSAMDTGATVVAEIVPLTA